MAYRPPDLNELGPVYSDAAWASIGKAKLLGTRVAVPCRVSSPCVGINSQQRAASELGMDNFKCKSVYDVCSDLRKPLQVLCGDSPLHLGPIAGDVTQVSLDELEDSEIFVAGPPCPPYSSIGVGGEETDVRSDVFYVVESWILELASRGCLRGFVLENVRGILTKRKGKGESFG